MATNPTTAPTTNPVRLTITKLMAAVRLGKVEAIRDSLSTYGLPTNGTKTTDYTVLQSALERRKNDIAKMLLQAGCNVNDPTGEARFLSTPLYLAVNQGDNEIMMMLLQKNATIDIKDYCSGQTPLHVAAAKRLTNTLWKLLQFDTNVNLCNRNGKTVLQMVLDQDGFEYRANVTVHPDIVRKLLTKGASVSCKDKFNQTPLHLAAKLKQKDILPMLLPLATDVNLCDNEGNSVLHVLLSTKHANTKSNDEPKNIEILNMLLKKGAKIDLLNKCDQSPAHLAAENRHLNILLQLLKYSMNINQMDNDGKTVLHRLLDNFQGLSDCLVRELLQLVKVLVSKGAKGDVKNKQGETALHLAARCAKREPNVLWNLFQSKGIDVNVADTHGNTVLHILTSESDPNMQLVKLLLQKGLKIDVKNSSRETPLEVVARHNRLALLREFLPYVVDVNSCDNDMSDTIMHQLLRNSSGVNLLGTVSELLKRGASVDAKNKNGITPVFFAAESKQWQLLLDLLRKSQDLPGQTAMRSKCDVTLLHEVLRGMCVGEHVFVDETNREILRILLKNGAIIDQCTIIKQMPIHQQVLFKRPDLIMIFAQCVTRANVTGNEGKTLLYFLDKLPVETLRDYGNQVVELTKILLSNGATLEGISEKGESVLDLACKSKELLKVLLECSGDVATARDSGGNTLLHTYLQSEERSLETVRMLVGKGVKVDASNQNGKTATHMAAKFGELEILQFLILHTNEVNVCDERGNSMLHILLSPKSTLAVDSTGGIAETTDKKLLETVELLLQRGLNVNVANSSGETHLHRACRKFRPDVCRLLLKNGAETRARDKLGNTALHFLCQDEEIEREGIAAAEKKMLRYFLSHGCSVNDKNESGLTALHVAAKYGRTNLVEALIASGADVYCAELQDGALALHLAAANQRNKVVEYLLRCGVDVNALQTSDDSTCLHLSMRQSARLWLPPWKLKAEPVCAALLLEHGADPELRDNFGRTALHRACWYDNFSGLKALLEHGADLNAEDDGGFTAPRYASGMSTRTLLLLHLVKLKVAGMRISEGNLRMLEEYEGLYYGVEGLQYSFREAEVEELRKIILDRRTSLCNILRMSANQLAIYNNNLGFQKILASTELKTKFHHYGSLITACARIGKARGELLEPATDSLRRLTGIPLPESCSYRIFEYTSNEELRGLIMAGCRNDRKRRLSDSEAEDVLSYRPAKLAKRRSSN